MLSALRMVERVVLESARPSRLSIIVAAAGLIGGIHPQRRAFLDQTLSALLALEDPLSTEIIAVIDADGRGTLETYVRESFADAVREGRLSIVASPGLGNLAHAFNLGVQSARGTYLSFLQIGQSLPHSHLIQLDSWLNRHDLVIGVTEPLEAGADWVRFLLRDLDLAAGSSAAPGHAALRPRLVPSASVVKRTEFEALGGFAERWVGMAEFEFWLRAIERAQSSDSRERVQFAVVPWTGVAGVNSAALDPAVSSVIDRFREAVSLAQLTRSLPKRYWATIGRRLLRRDGG